MSAVRRLPPLPSLRALAAELRALHEAWSRPEAGGGTVCLARVYDPDRLGHEWRVECVGDSGGIEFGSEDIPGSREVECTCRNGWRIRASEPGGPESCRACGGAGRVHVPTPFDATAAARRLLAAARDAGHK